MRSNSRDKENNEKERDGRFSVTKLGERMENVNWEWNFFRAFSRKNRSSSAPLFGSRVSVVLNRRSILWVKRDPTHVVGVGIIDQLDAYK